MSELAPDNWNTYRTRFLVSAKQLTRPLTFTDPLGREHHGRPGDYLVQSSNGLLRIAPREIFEDVYVMMEGDPQRQEPKSSFTNQPAGHFQPTSAPATCTFDGTCGKTGRFTRTYPVNSMRYNIL